MSTRVPRILHAHLRSTDGRHVTCDRSIWDDLIGRLLHETQIHIVEAMRWIGRPMSASELVQILDQETSLPNLSYHVRRLAEIGAVKQTSSRPVRGAKERFYGLRTVTEEQD